MLPNHAPLVVAEPFGTLEALYPGRNLRFGWGSCETYSRGLTWIIADIVFCYRCFRRVSNRRGKQPIPDASSWRFWLLFDSGVWQTNRLLAV
jgi:hypothetical protein